MRTRIFTLLFAFLAIAGNAVWGQDQDDTTPTEPCAFNITKTATGEDASENTDYVFERRKKGKNENDILHVLIIKTSGLTISNKNGIEETNQCIEIDSKEVNPLEVTFNSVKIKTGEEGYNTVYKIPFRIIAGSHVNLKLEGENSLIHATTTSGSNCILVGEEYKPQASLSIYGDGKLNLSSGSLETSLGGAAIESHNSPLTIAGGTINVQKGVIQNTSDNSNAIISITGGEITLEKPIGGFGYGIGGTNCDVSISGGKIDIKNFNGSHGAIGGGNEVTISGDKTEINMINNHSYGISANEVTISGGKCTVIDDRTSKSSTGINATTAITLSNCEIEMDVQTGISGRNAQLQIDNNATINITATSTPISVASTDVSNKSLVTVKSTWPSSSGIEETMTINNGNAYVVADVNGKIEGNRSNWKGIVFEGELRGQNKLVNGYVYDNITLDRDFTMEEKCHLIYCEPSTLTINDDYKLTNNGRVFIAYEKEDENIDAKITEGTGSISYEIFFDEESLSIPNSFRSKLYNKSIGDVIVSIGDGNNDRKIITEDILHKKTHPLNKEEGDMVFGKSKTNITLGLDNKELNNSSYPKVAENYIIKSFDVKTKKDNRVIAENVQSLQSFYMPTEAVVIYNLKIEGAYKLDYELAGELEGKTVDVIFKDQKQNVIESAAEDDLIWIFIMAPGYESFDVTDIEAESSAYIGSDDQPAFQSRYSNDKCKVYVFPSMPKGDVTFTITGEASNPIPYKVSIDGNIQNGEVIASKEDGTDATDAATTIYYKDKIVVKATPEEGYELKSLQYKYTIEDKETVVDITDYDSEKNEYSFSMPAADVFITAVFEVPTPDEPDDEDKDDDDQGGGTIQKPIKYYNIYIDTVCPGLDVEVSKDVVQEGHQVSAYLTIQAECDTTGMRFEYKRGLFGYWKDLKELEGVQPGEYIIKNIYTDIYIRALDATLPEEEPTGIEDVEGAKAYAKDGSIYVYTPSREQVTIISMSGAIIKNEEQVGLQSYSVSRGIYIVRIGDKVFKLKN